jgi:flagellar protein FliO/FliZ
LQRLGAVRGPAGRLLSVIDAIHVGPRDRIVLVEVDGQRVLLGVSPGTIRPLLDLGATGRGIAPGAFAGELQSSLRTAREQAS